MARQKKPVHRVQMTEGKRNIIHQLLEEYLNKAISALVKKTQDRKRMVQVEQSEQMVHQVNPARQDLHRILIMEKLQRRVIHLAYLDG